MDSLPLTKTTPPEAERDWCENNMGLLKFSADGQHWGNPIYDWQRMAATGYRWWVERVRRGLAQVDLIRLDHFRGFAQAWHIPAGETSAKKGRWVDGPGAGNGDKHDTAVTRAYWESLPDQVRQHLHCAVVGQLTPITQKHTIEGLVMGAA